MSIRTITKSITLNIQYYNLSNMYDQNKSLKIPLLFERESLSQETFLEELQINQPESKVFLYNKSILNNVNKKFKQMNYQQLKQQQQIQQQILDKFADVHEQIIANDEVRDEISNINRKSIRIQFKRKGKDLRKKDKNNSSSKQKQTISRSKIHSNSLSSIFEVSGLRMKTSWEVTTQKKKTFNSKIFNLSENLQRPLYLFNLFFNTIYRVSLILILTIMVVYEQDFLMMEIIGILEIVGVFLYALAMIKFLYTRKDDESIYFQKYFSDRDITDIEMDRVLRKHFTSQNILKNLSNYIKPNTKFRNNIKISFLKQQIFKRIQIVLSFIPLTVIFLTVPNTFRFQCYYPVEMILSATIIIEFIRITIHYLLIFIWS